MIKISEMLDIGEENAIRASDLCDILHINRQALSACILWERRHGAPICSNTGSRNPGYYLAATRKEMLDFCESLHRRAGEIYKTRAACLKTAEQLPDKGA